MQHERPFVPQIEKEQKTCLSAGGNAIQHFPQAEKPHCKATRSSWELFILVKSLCQGLVQATRQSPGAAPGPNHGEDGAGGWRRGGAGGSPGRGPSAGPSLLPRAGDPLGLSALHKSLNFN